MKKLLTVLALVAGPALAEPVCDMRGAEPVDILEASKAEFLKGDFEAFVEVSTEIMGSAREGLIGPLETLAKYVPDGFESCETVLQRREAGGMVQEVITFNIDGQNFPMSLYLLAIPIKGKWQIAHLTFDTKLTTVLDSVH